MLGDGYIGYPNFTRDQKAFYNAQYRMTMVAQVYPYLLSL